MIPPLYFDVSIGSWVEYSRSQKSHPSHFYCHYRIGRLNNLPLTIWNCLAWCVRMDIIRVCCDRIGRQNNTYSLIISPGTSFSSCLLFIGSLFLRREQKKKKIIKECIQTGDPLAMEEPGSLFILQEQQRPNATTQWWKRKRKKKKSHRRRRSRGARAFRKKEEKENRFLFKRKC